MKYSGYPSYKPSGVEWLAEVPEHWEVLALKRRFRIINGGTPSSAEQAYWDGDIIWLTPDDLGKNERKRIEKSRRQISKEGLDNCGARLVPKCSIVISTRAPIGHVALADVESCTNQGCRSLVPEGKDVCSDFFFYSLIASKPVLQATGKGTTFMELSAGALGSHLVSIPPPREQRAIADFLDAETTKLDALVAKRWELIERLKEKRSALISRTVTRGLPPEAARATGLKASPKLKPSGIEWLGEIPEHWEVIQLGRKIMLQRGIDITKDEQIDGIVPVVSSGGVSSFHDQPFAAGPGVIVGRKGTAGAVYYVETAFWPHDTTLWVKDFRGNDPRYVFYKFCAMDLASFDTGSANPTVNRNLVHPVTVSWPPVPEQRAIASYLDRETSKIDRMVAKVEAAIELLQEYRTALITAAVTGKIDVRKQAA
jgi:type I restriction enzyme S subunit